MGCIGLFYSRWSHLLIGEMGNRQPTAIKGSLTLLVAALMTLTLIALAACGDRPPKAGRSSLSLRMEPR